MAGAASSAFGYLLFFDPQSLSVLPCNTHATIGFLQSTYETHPARTLLDNANCVMHPNSGTNYHMSGNWTIFWLFRSSLATAAASKEGLVRSTLELNKSLYRPQQARQEIESWLKLVGNSEQGENTVFLMIHVNDQVIALNKRQHLNKFLAQQGTTVQLTTFSAWKSLGIKPPSIS